MESVGTGTGNRLLVACIHKEQSYSDLKRLISAVPVVLLRWYSSISFVCNKISSVLPYDRVRQKEI